MESESFDNPGQVNLRGSLLLADPSLRDPNFHRTVLLLTDHEIEHGAHGYILNRPMGKKVGDLLDGASFQTLASVPVYLGGPVSQERLTFASLAWDATEKKLAWTTHLSVGDARELMAAGADVRAFVGYAGWSEGQLEGELRQRAWITRKPISRVVELPRADELWSDLLKSMGPRFSLLARMPDDPSLN